MSTPFMTSSSIALLVLICTGAARGAFTQQDLSSPTDAQKPSPSAMECTICKLVVKDVAAFNSSDGTSVAKILAAIDKDCDKVGAKRTHCILH